MVIYALILGKLLIIAFKEIYKFRELVNLLEVENLRVIIAAISFDYRRDYLLGSC